MKKYLVFFVGVLGVFIASIFIFYFGRPRSPKTEEVEHPLRNPRPPDEVSITYSNPGRSKEILRSVVLNKLVVDDFSLGVVEVGGGRRPVLNLGASFNYQGRERKLTIPIVDTISFRKVGLQGFEEEGDISVASLNLEKGEIINVAFSYIPKENFTEKEEVVDFCKARAYKQCLMYIELGFGNIPIDFGEYLSQILDNTQRIDYKVAFPNFISLLEN